ncbi:MAG: glycosyltransferase family 4 protein [Methanobacterium sp.]|nr:glycosyltransferase family 4 protein [Methanobacterium sp.]
MKIGVITSAYPEYEDDPHGIFVHRLMREIRKRGHEVYVIAPFAGEKTQYTLEGIDVKRFNYFYPKRYQRLAGRAGMIDNVKEGFWVKLQILPFLFFNILYSLRKLRKMDVIHVQWPIPNGLGALFLKKIYRIPYMSTIYGEEIYLSKLYHMIPILRWLVNNSSKIVTISTATRNTCLEAGMDKNLEIIPFGVDTDFFRPIDNPRTDEFFQILSVGYLIERKGHEYLIRAMKEVLKKQDNVRLKIVGSGPFKTKLKNLIKELDLEEAVEIIENVSDEELLNLYTSSDLFVLPSIIDSQGNTEGLGLVLLEAMACGLPVIGSNVGGITDIIVDGETGLLVQEKNVLEIYSSINKMIEDDDQRQQIRKNGQLRVKEQFSWEKIARNYQNIYLNLI